MATLVQRYKLKQNFSAPNIYNVKGKRFSSKVFNQGQEVFGNVYDGKKKPVFENCILVHDTYLIPLSLLEMVEEVKTVNYSGPMPKGLPKVEFKRNDVKKQAQNYTSGFFVGATAGILIVMFSIHKQWMKPTWSNKILMPLGFGMLGGYAASKI